MNLLHSESQIDNKLVLQLPQHFKTIYFFSFFLPETENSALLFLSIIRFIKITLKGKKMFILN